MICVVVKFSNWESYDTWGGVEWVHPSLEIKVQSGV